MARLKTAGWLTGVLCYLLIHSAAAAATGDSQRGCAPELTRQIPARPASAPGGKTIVERVMKLAGRRRDAVVSAEVMAGNIPGFLRRLTPVVLAGKLPGGREVTVTICVTPDYLAIGTNTDFVRVPLGLPAAAEIADRLGFLLPTTRMVDAIHAQAGVRLAPSPMPPNSRMGSTDYLWRHNQTVEHQRGQSGRTRDALTAGQKKDLVLSNRLRRAPGRVAIYGWHRKNGAPIQPLSTVHGAEYADYSHGVRLVSATAYVDGAARPLSSLLEDPGLALILSSEGPIAKPALLLASLHGGKRAARRAPDGPRIAARN